MDDLLRHPDDLPSIGMILVKSKNEIVVEYVLRDVNKPISVSKFRTARVLPEQLRGSLPTIEELEQELRAIEDE